MDNSETNINIDFEERSWLSRAYSAVTKAIGEMAIISVAVSGAFRIFSKEFSMAESLKAGWTGPMSWLTYGAIGLNAWVNYSRESRRDKAALNEHIENAVREKQLHDAGLKAAEVTSILPNGSSQQTSSLSQPATTPADTATELAHTQQALSNVSHELEVVTNYAANLKAPAESHAAQAVIDKATAEQATATIH